MDQHHIKQGRYIQYGWSTEQDIDPNKVLQGCYHFHQIPKRCQSLNFVIKPENRQPEEIVAQVQGYGGYLNFQIS